MDTAAARSARLACVDARDEKRQLYEVTAVEWKLYHFLGVDNSADCGILALQKGRGSEYSRRAT